jgi:hypothetical protein
MLKIEMPGSEPTPQFATDAEVAFAQWLRSQLERRYLGQSETTSELTAQLSEVH